MKIHTHHPVHVAIDKAFAEANSFCLFNGMSTSDLVNTLDLRWNAVLHKEGEPQQEPLKVVVNQWLMTEKMRRKLSHGFDENPNSYQARNSMGTCARVEDGGEFIFNVNIFLTVLGQYGFDADFDPQFVNMIEPFLGDCIMNAWRDETSDAKIRDRIIAGVKMPRADFIEKFDKFLTKYGM